MYKILRRGNALTLVITMVMVMTLIGVPLLSLVVYNFYTREFDLTIKRAEYKNEMFMDRIYIATQNCVINAISKAKEDAIALVDTEVENQKDLYWEYAQMHKQFEDEIKNDASNAGLTAEEIETKVQEKLSAYYLAKYGAEFSIGNVKIIDIETGLTNPVALQEAYNTQFKQTYKDIITNMEVSADGSSLYEFAEVRANYDGVIGDTQDIAFSREDTYTPINLTENDSAEINIYVDDSLKAEVATLYKAERVPAVRLSADFMIGTPDFNQISSVEQKTVKLSNPILHKTLVADGNLVIAAGNELKVDGDAVINGNSIDEEKGIIVGGKLNVTGILATAQDINLSGDLETGTNSLHYKNFFVNGAGSSAIINGDIYAKDDLEINTDDFTITQAADKYYYGFEDVSSEMNPDSSSSIIVNTTTVSDESKLEVGKIYLAGRAFMKDVKSTEPGDAYYKTGESISIKGNNVAYQTPLPSGAYIYSNMKFGQYLYNPVTPMNIAIPMSLVENFIVDPQPNFDVEHKWKYFQSYAEIYNNIAKPNIKIASIEYMQGAGVGKVGDGTEVGVIESKTTEVGDPVFKTNAQNQYDKQTAYYGYYSGAARNLFGAGGWILTGGDIDYPITEGDDSSGIRVYNGELSLTDVTLPKYKVIICTGNLSIDVSTLEVPAEFSGLIIAGGDITITGELNITNDKNDVIDIIIDGADTDNVSETWYADKNSLYNMFAYDDSGTTYVITKSGADSFINISELIGITNWKKWDRGFF